ncbi:MAG: hypothetical protein GY863_08760 [bacterium]|nr:hypothetical protein [bacterium]
MQIILGIVLIIFLALIGERLSFSGKRFPGSLNIFFLTGTEFLLIGLILGPSVINMINRDVVSGMYPFMGLGLGWLGLLYGIHFNFKKLLKFPQGYLFSSLTQSLFSFLLIFAVSYLTLPLLDITGKDSILISIILGTIGSCSSQTSLALLNNDHKYRKSRSLRMMRFITSIGDLPGLIVFGIMICALKTAPPLPGMPYIFIQWISASIGLGFVFGWIMIFLLNLRLNHVERILFTIGIVLFSGGVSTYFQLSPLFVNLIAGMTIANFCRDHHLLDDIMALGEKPIYLILLVLAGALWIPGTVSVFALAAVYYLIRISVKYLGSLITTNTFLRSERFNSHTGLGFISQGGMAIAMIINLQMYNFSFLDADILSMAIIAIILSEITGPELAKAALAGEAEN